MDRQRKRAGDLLDAERQAVAMSESPGEQVEGVERLGHRFLLRKVLLRKNLE